MEFFRVAATSVGSVAALFLLTKLMGNKQISQLNMFDYITGITIGSIAAELATELETPLYPTLAMVVYGLSALGISVWTNKSLKARAFFTGRPQILMDGGVIYRQQLKKARLDVSEFLTMCRIAGYFDLSQVKTAVLESNGNISFLPDPQYRPCTPADMKLLVKPECFCPAVILDGRVLEKSLELLALNTSWLQESLHGLGYADETRIVYAYVGADGKLNAFSGEKATAHRKTK